MKKFRRNLFSGFFLFILIIIIEVAFIFLLQFFMDDVLGFGIEIEAFRSAIAKRFDDLVEVEAEGFG